MFGQYEYTVDDGNGRTDTEAVQVTIDGVNDVPVFPGSGDWPAVALTRGKNITAVTTVTATDVDVPADTPTYAIIGVADAALLGMDLSGGVLSFNVAPDYEAPGDAGAGNVHDVTVQVSDGNVGMASTVGAGPVSGPYSWAARDWSNGADLPLFLHSAAYGTTSEQIRFYYPASMNTSTVELGSEFLQQLNAFSDDLAQTMEQTIVDRPFIPNLLKSTGLVLSTVILAWLARGSKFSGFPSLPGEILIRFQFWIWINTVVRSGSEK